MNIYLIRHGETALNESGRYQGATDLPLSPRGRGLLRRAAFAPTQVYVSPLRRCVETARILFPDSALIPVEGLREMNFGLFEGRSAAEMEQDAAYRAWVEGGCEGRCPGGEMRREFTQRVLSAFLPLLEQARRTGQETLVIVAHGGTQMAVLEHMGRPKRPFYRWKTGNGCGFLLRDCGETLALLGEWKQGSAET